MQPNESGLDQAIQNYQKAIEAHPQFAFVYARLSLAYSRQFNKFRDPAALSLAERNADLAVRYNAASMNAILARATVNLQLGPYLARTRRSRHGTRGDPQSAGADCQGSRLPLSRALRRRRDRLPRADSQPPELLAHVQRARVAAISSSQIPKRRRRCSPRDRRWLHASPGC